MGTDYRAVRFWDADVPGERLEGRWGGTEEDSRGRAIGLVQTSDGAVRVPLTSVLERRAERLATGEYVRIVYEGLALTLSGHAYRRHRIEELLDPPPDPEPAPTMGQQSLW
jgi:hypothetical protein